MSEDKKAESNNKSVRSIIKMRIFQERIGTLDYYYSLLNKVNNSGIGTNERLVVLAGNKDFGYCKNLPSDASLPFGEVTKIPNVKAAVDILNISTVKANKEVLEVSFKKDGKDVKWEFKCPSKECSDQWRSKIEAAQSIRREPEAISKKTELKQGPEERKMVQQKGNSENSHEGKPIQQKVDTNENGILSSKQQTVSNHQQQDNQQRPLNTQYTKENQSHSNSKPSPGEKQPTAHKDRENPKSRGSGQQSPQFQKKQKQEIAENKEISGPVKSFFVGGVGVSSERDQQQLKRQIGSILQLNSKAKEEYSRKRQQEQQLKADVSAQKAADSLFPLTQILKTMIDDKYLIEKLNQDWSYQFAKGGNQYEVIDQFRSFCQLVAKKIIDQLGLQMRKRFYQPSEVSTNCQKYEVNGVSLMLLNAQLKEVSMGGYAERDRTGNNLGTIISSDLCKEYQQQLKNYNYILKLTRNKGRIRVPLAAMIEYKGFVLFAKAMIPFSQQYSAMESLQKQLDILEEESRINNSVFQDPDCAKIVAVQAKVYQKLARAENNPRKFDICYIDDAKHYLPNDFTHFSKDRPYEKLRSELLQDDDLQEIKLFGENMANIMNRIKIPEHVRNGVNDLQNISKIIPTHVDTLAMELENLDEVFTNSKELADIMHDHGLNIRHLGMLMERAKEPWLKNIIMSEIVARCAKYYLRFDLQDSLLNMNEKTVEIVHRFQIKQTIHFLNKMLGSGTQSDTFWKLLNKQAQTNFYVSINREELNCGYLMQALLHHTRVRLKDLPQSLVFFSEGNNGLVFSQQQFVGFETHSKTYDLSFTELYSTVHTYMNEVTMESYDQLRMLLNLSRNPIPNHFKMSSYYDKILLFLVVWLSPEQGNKIYYPEQFQMGEIRPSKSLYQIKLTQIKWALKENNEPKSQKVRDWLVDHINKWLGSYHPILTDLYDIYAKYYSIQKDQQKKAVNYCKSSIKNQQKLLTTNSIKLADGYFQLGTIYTNYGRKIQALNTFKKAQEIFKNQENTEFEAYGIVCLKMGQLYLALNSIEEAIQSSLEAVDQLTNAYDKTKLIESMELTCRCYEVSQEWETYVQFTQEFLMERVGDFIDEVELLERILKMVIMPQLHHIASHSSTTSVPQKLLHILRELPQSTHSPNMAYNYIRNRILEATLPQYFLEELKDIEEVLKEIESNGMVARWKGFETMTSKTLLNKLGGSSQNRGFDFLACLEALSIFLGIGFLEGVLLEQ